MDSLLFVVFINVFVLLLSRYQFGVLILQQCGEEIFLNSVIFCFDCFVVFIKLWCIDLLE